MPAVDVLRVSEFNSYWKPNSKSNLKFLTKAELNKYINTISKYPEQFRNEETVLNLRRLHTKCKRDGLMLATCMANTFAIRKFDIRENHLGISTAIRKYPGLADYYQIQEEFQRIAEKDVFQFEEEVRDMLWASVLIDTERPPQCENQFWKDKYDAGDDTLKRLTFFIYDKMDGVVAEDFIVYKLAGQKGKLSDKIKKDQPTILVDGTIWSNDGTSVYCEKVKVLSGLSFFNAFLASFYLYYIFALEYPADKLDMYKALDQILANVNEKKELAIEWPDEN